MPGARRIETRESEKEKKSKLGRCARTSSLGTREVGHSLPSKPRWNDAFAGAGRSFERRLSTTRAEKGQVFVVESDKASSGQSAKQYAQSVARGSLALVDVVLSCPPYFTEVVVRGWRV